jgi:hypothetical protein
MLPLPPSVDTEGKAMEPLPASQPHLAAFAQSAPDCAASVAWSYERSFLAQMAKDLHNNWISFSTGGQPPYKVLVILKQWILIPGLTQIRQNSMANHQIEQLR